MKRLNKLYLLVAVSLFSACADLDINSDFTVDRPEDIAVNEFINGYDVLKNYIDRTATPNFKLGMGVSISDFAKKETTFSLAVSNFDEVSATATDITHGTVVADDGSMSFFSAVNLFGTTIDAGLTAFGPALCWHANQNATYLNELIAPIILPEETSSGTTIFFDFESSNIGDEFQMTGNGFAKIVEDPSGQSGKVLHVGGPANQSYPILNITLPVGRKLGEYKTLIMDFNGSGTSGLYGQGMMLAINDMALVKYGSPFSFGCPDGNWGRGSIILDLSKLNLSDTQQELTNFQLKIGSGTGSGNYYIDNIKMTWEAGSSPIGSMAIANFESNSIGDTYEMSNGGSATVVTDPAESTKKALNVISNQSHPKFSVALPVGVKLGDCTQITLKFYGTGSTGRYGQGMRLGINDSGLFNFKSPSDQGCVDNKWGALILDLKTITLDETQKNLKEFTIAVGSATGAGNYFIDDVSIYWEKNNIIEKTPEEKKEIISEALESWIAAFMKVNDGTIKTWDVIREPMSDDDNYMLRSAETEQTVSETDFYWSDYLGENYARTVVAYARQQFVENGGIESDLKLFINESGLNKTDSRKCERLIEMIKQWEEDNTTVIDGIGIKLNLIFSFDPVVQEQNDKTLNNVLQKLADTGKLIRISELSVQAADNNDNVINSVNLTAVQQQTISLYYEYIVRKYFEIIPAVQCYGITHATPIDKTDTIGLWDGKYNRKYTYVGFADGFLKK